MIDIIVTGKDESLEKTLFSIAIQTIRDQIHVILVSEKKHSFMKEFQKKIKIEEVLTKEKSIGKKRQVGYEKADGDTILFMNSGDCFYDVFALHNLNKILLDNDVVIGGIENIEKKYSTHYLVGNLYKRKALKSHRILFRDSDGLDNGFHQLFFMSHPKIVYSSDIIYHENIIYEKDENYYNNIIQDSLFALQKAKNRSYASRDIAKLLYDVILFFAYYFHEGKDTFQEDLFLKFKPLLKEYQYYKKFLVDEDIQYISDINLSNRTIDQIYSEELEKKNDM